MNLFQRIKLHICLFFEVTLPSFWDNRSQATRFSVGCFGFTLLILVGILAVIGIRVGIAFGFFALMCHLNNNKTYELLYPVEEVASIEIVYIDESHYLYGIPLAEISDTLDQNTIPGSYPVDDTLIPACINDLQQLSASKWWNDPNPKITAGTLMITYENGSREWICAKGTFYCDALSGKDSMTWYFFNNDEFDAFLISYGYIPPD